MPVKIKFGSPLSSARQGWGMILTQVLQRLQIDE